MTSRSGAVGIKSKTSKESKVLFEYSIWSEWMWGHSFDYGDKKRHALFVDLLRNVVRDHTDVGDELAELKHGHFEALQRRALESSDPEISRVVMPVWSMPQQTIQGKDAEETCRRGAESECVGRRERGL